MDIKHRHIYLSRKALWNCEKIKCFRSVYVDIRLLMQRSATLVDAAAAADDDDGPLRGSCI